eukprot:4633294-Pleurochrysis_carterae.AAC.1
MPFRNISPIGAGRLLPAFSVLSISPCNAAPIHLQKCKDSAGCIAPGLVLAGLICTLGCFLTWKGLDMLIDNGMNMPRSNAAPSFN